MRDNRARYNISHMVLVVLLKRYCSFINVQSFV